MVEEDEPRNTDLKGQELRRTMEILKAENSGLLTRIPQLKDLIEHNEMMEADIDKRFQELEVKEKELQNLSLDLEERRRNFDEDCVTQARTQRELDSKSKQLRQVMAEIRRHSIEARKAEDRKREVEGETDRKMKELALILDQIEQYGIQYATLTYELESGRRLLEIRSHELISKEKELGCVNSDLELKETKVESLKSCIALCGNEIDLKSTELGGIQKLIEKQTNDLRVMHNQRDSIKLMIEEFTEELVAKEKKHKDILGTVCRMEERAKEIKAAEAKANDLIVKSEKSKREVEGKEKELNLVKNQIESEEKKLVQLEEETDSKKKDLALIVSSIEKRSRELESKEKELQSLNKKIEAGKAEADDLKKLAEECTQLRSTRNQLTVRLESEEKKLVQLKREMDKETDSKKKDLVLIVSKIEESGKQLAAVDELVESQRRRLELQSAELISKDMELERVAESRKRFDFDIEVKEKKVQALNDMITISEERLDLKSKDLKDIQKLLKQQTSEIGVMHKRRNSMKLSIQKLSEKLDAKERQHKEILEAICKSSSEVESIKTEASDLISKSQWFRRDVADREKELEQLKNQIKVGENELIRLSKSILDCTKELSSRRDEVEAMKNNNIQREDILKRQLRQTSSVPVSAPINDTSQQNATETGPSDDLTHHEISTSLDPNDVSTVLKYSLNPAEFVLELVQDEIREEVDLHDSLMANWVLLFEELAKIQRSYDPQVQHKAKQVAALWKKKIAARALKSSLEVLAFLLFIVVYGIKILLRTEFILELMEEEIREEVDLHDSLMKNWVLLFEELARIQRSDDPQMQRKATQVATLWKRKIAIEAPKSSLEVLAFLMFVVEYGLKEVINEEETALLASSIAQYEQSPRLFISLGFKREIRECVKDLIKKSQYIPAVRLICLYKLNEEFLPSQLLMKEINNLKQPALEAKDKVAGRLRAILELVAVYKLEIDLPGDLVAKLMVQRENLTAPVVQCKVKYGNSSSTPQANSPNLASAQRSSVNLRVPKLEVKPHMIW